MSVRQGNNILAGGVVCDNTPTSGSQNAVSSGGVYTALSGKVSTGHEVIDFQEPTALNNYTWYRKYADGWVEQGGKGVTTLTIVLPVPMADDNYFITTSNNTYSDSAGTPVVVYYNKTSTGFALQGRWNGSGTSGIGCCWQVSGMAAN